MGKPQAVDVDSLMLVSDLEEEFGHLIGERPFRPYGNSKPPLKKHIRKSAYSIDKNQLKTIKALVRQGRRAGGLAKMFGLSEYGMHKFLKKLEKSGEIPEYSINRDFKKDL